MTTDNADPVNPLAVRSSVIDVPSAPRDGAPPSIQNSILWFVSGAADEFSPWGHAPKVRDRQLRDFIGKEPMFAEALGIICFRNAGFSWMLDGPELLTTRYKRVLENANNGKGWVDFITKLSIDVYTQDSGAFIEYVREFDAPEAGLVGINHLDSERCYHTGAPMAPVIYEDADNKYHLLKWYQCMPVAELPMPVEGLYGMQLSALSRILKRCQEMRNVLTYLMEKSGGNYTRALHLLKGVTVQEVDDALGQWYANQMTRGNMRYSMPALVGTLDPKADVGHDTIEFASLPDNFSREELMKWYIAELAMAFGEDYQTFAPLPGGGLGTSTQSEVMAKKTRGKGPAVFQKLIAYALNSRALPQNVEFKWDEQDNDEDFRVAEIKEKRATTRAARIESGELTPGAARRQALEDGDLSQELYDALGGDDVNADPAGDIKAERDTQKLQAQTALQPATSGQPVRNAPAGREPQAEGAKEAPDARDDVEQEAIDAFESVFSRINKRLLKELADLGSED